MTNVLQEEEESSIEKQVPTPAEEESVNSKEIKALSSEDGILSVIKDQESSIARDGVNRNEQVGEVELICLTEKTTLRKDDETFEKNEKDLVRSQDTSENEIVLVAHDEKELCCLVE